MKTIIVPASVAPFQVDGFPEACARSERFKGGAVHIRPAQTLELTDDEWALIAARHPELAQVVTVLEDGPTTTTEEHRRVLAVQRGPQVSVDEPVSPADEPKKRSK